MASPWDLMTAGEYDRAVVAYSEQLAHKREALPHRNRATAFLMLRKYEDAFADIEAADALSQPHSRAGRVHGDADQLRMGVIEWITGRRADAANRWLRISDLLLRGRVDYSDPTGGIGAASLLRFGAARLQLSEHRELANKLINRTLARPRFRSWPLPVGQFLSGAIDADQLLSNVRTTPILREREQCQARFAMAVVADEDGSESRYLTNMRHAAVSPLAILEDEYFLAVAETSPTTGA
jgi:hypothetical protein